MEVLVRIIQPCFGGLTASIWMINVRPASRLESKPFRRWIETDSQRLAWQCLVPQWISGISFEPSEMRMMNEWVIEQSFVNDIRWPYGHSLNPATTCTLTNPQAIQEWRCQLASFRSTRMHSARFAIRNIARGHLIQANTQIPVVFQPHVNMADAIRKANGVSRRWECLWRPAPRTTRNIFLFFRMENSLTCTLVYT